MEILVSSPDVRFSVFPTKMWLFSRLFSRLFSSCSLVVLYQFCRTAASLSPTCLVGGVSQAKCKREWPATLLTEPRLRSILGSPQACGPARIFCL